MRRRGSARRAWISAALLKRAAMWSGVMSAATGKIIAQASSTSAPAATSAGTADVGAPHPLPIIAAQWIGGQRSGKALRACTLAPAAISRVHVVACPKNAATISGVDRARELPCQP
jgi:hypothetical protein